MRGRQSGSSSLGRQNMLSVVEVQWEGAAGTGGLRMSKILPASSTPA